MKCPHCLIEFHDELTKTDIGNDVDGEWKLIKRTCPVCRKFILHLENGRTQSIGNGQYGYRPHTTLLVRPRATSRMTLSSEVPTKYQVDYTEACCVHPDSAKASAALSRRILQSLLRDQTKIKHGDLANEIQQVLDSKQLPSHLSESLDAIRNTGNFAAHPIKSTSTGEIVDVEPGEAEWNLDVLEQLFDFFFVQPAITKAKRDALNKKLAEAGKPPMK